MHIEKDGNRFLMGQRKRILSYLLILFLILAGCQGNNSGTSETQIDKHLLKSPQTPKFIRNLVSFPRGSKNAARYYNKILKKVQKGQILVDTLRNGLPYIELREPIMENVTKATDQKKCKFHPKYFPYYSLKTNDSIRDNWILIKYLVNGVIERSKIDQKCFEKLKRVIIMGDHLFSERAHIAELMTGLTTMIRGAQLLQDNHSKEGDSTLAAKYGNAVDSLNSIMQIYSKKISYIRKNFGLRNWIAGGKQEKYDFLSKLQYFIKNNSDIAFSGELINTLILLKHYNEKKQFEQEIDRCIDNIRRSDNKVYNRIIREGLNISQDRKRTLIADLEELEYKVNQAKTDKKTK